MVIYGISMLSLQVELELLDYRSDPPTRGLDVAKHVPRRSHSNHCRLAHTASLSPMGKDLDSYDRTTENDSGPLEIRPAVF